MSFLFPNISYSQYNYTLDSLEGGTDSHCTDSYGQNQEYYDKQSMNTSHDAAVIDDFKGNSNFHADLSDCSDNIPSERRQKSLICANKQLLDRDLKCKKKDSENDQNEMYVFDPENANSSQKGSGLLNRIVKKIISSKQTKVSSEAVDNQAVPNTIPSKCQNSFNKSNDFTVEATEGDLLLNSSGTHDHDETERSLVSADIQIENTNLTIRNDLHGSFSKEVEENGDFLDSGENGQSFVAGKVKKSLKVQTFIPESDATSVLRETAGIEETDDQNHGEMNDFGYPGSQNIVADVADGSKLRELEDANIERNGGLKSNPNDISDKRNDADYSMADTNEKQTSKKFYCEICNKSFTTNKSLIRHNLIHDKEVRYRYSCSLCGREFREAYNLKVHMFSHTGERLFSCEICGKTYNNRSNLNRHLQIHTGRKAPKREYPCKLCDKVFSASGSRSRHMTLHTGDKKYDKKCTVCDRSFRDVHNLKKHMITHTGEKNFGCEICGKRFASKFSMQQHAMLIHTDTTPRFTCNTCQKFFKSQYSLKRHESKHDDGKKTERSCDTCGAEFSDKYALKRHLSKHSEEKQQSCSVCGIQFSEAAVLKLHMLVHS